MASFTDRIRSGWNAFVNDEREDPVLTLPSYGGVSTYQPQRSRFRISNERSIVSSVYTRLGLDLSSIDIRHTKHDGDDRYIGDVDSGLNDCLNLQANIDQASAAFLRDVYLSLFNTGVAAIVAVDTTLNPLVTGGYDVKTMRVGEITQWYPYHVRISLYNERKGLRQEITLPKESVAIVENPLYTIMNEPNSTLQRLIRKLSLLDSVDEATSSGKMDLIIQLPYVIKSDAKRQAAEQRRQDIEFQLKGSQYGIAYTDGTEKITQLNRPVENNLLNQIEYLTEQLYTQLGLTPEIMNGTADEATMLNYNNRTLEPIVTAVVQAMKRTFLTKTARTQGQSIDFFRDPFRLLPLSNIADIADKLTRNEILTSNEIRQKMGFKPSTDPKADQLVNANMPQAITGAAAPPPDDSGVDPNADPNAAPEDGTPAADTSIPANSYDTINDTLSSVFSRLGLTDGTPFSATADGDPDLDPDVFLSSLDDLDKEVDNTFSGLGLDDATS